PRRLDATDHRASVRFHLALLHGRRLNRYKSRSLQRLRVRMTDAGSPLASLRTLSRSLGNGEGRRARLLVGACAVLATLRAQPAFAQVGADQAQATLGQTTQGPATADGPPRLPDRAVHGVPGPDGLSPDELYLEADQVEQDDAHHLVTA